MTDPLFAQPSDIKAPEKVFGQAYRGLYHMPLLPGEDGTKSGGDWVPGGLTRMTNLVGAHEDTRALNIWEQGMGLIGLALAPELYEELVLIVAQAVSEGVVFERLRDYPALKEALAGAPHNNEKIDRSIIGRAKHIAKASAAAQRGTNRHTAWEHRGKTGELIGTAEIQRQVIDTERLLSEAGLVRVPGLSERVVRNVALRAVGKFDDVVMEESTGRLLMGDLKTKARPFYSWMTVDAQLAGYVRAEWMLTVDRTGYEPGPGWVDPFCGIDQDPRPMVDQTEGVILHVPSDGTPAFLRRADLVNGWAVAQTARLVMDQRAYGKSAGRHALSAWGSAER